MDWVKDHYTTVVQFGGDPLKGDIFGMKLLQLNIATSIGGLGDSAMGTPVLSDKDLKYPKLWDLLPEQLPAYE